MTATLELTDTRARLGTIVRALREVHGFDRPTCRGAPGYRRARSGVSRPDTRGRPRTT
jgi:hypothetical protein